MPIAPNNWPNPRVGYDIINDIDANGTTRQAHEEGNAMNYSKAVFLINKDVRAVLAIYDADPPDNTINAPKAKREMFKTMDPTLRVDELVVVPTDTRHLRTVVKITDVDVDVNFEASDQVKWIIGRAADEGHYQHLMAAEADAIQRIKSAEIRKKREDLKATMLKDIEATGLELSTLSLALPAPDASVEPKPKAE